MEIVLIQNVDELVDLARYGIVWTALFSAVFVMIPGLGYPIRFWNAATLYTGMTVPVTLQSHNWILFYGTPVAALALRYYGRSPRHRQVQATE